MPSAGLYNLYVVDTDLPRQKIVVHAGTQL